MKRHCARGARLQQAAKGEVSLCTFRTSDPFNRWRLTNAFKSVLVVGLTLFSCLGIAGGTAPDNSATTAGTQTLSSAVTVTCPGSITLECGTAPDPSVTGVAVAAVTC